MSVSGRNQISGHSDQYLNTQCIRPSPQQGAPFLKQVTSIRVGPVILLEGQNSTSVLSKGYFS